MNGNPRRHDRSPNRIDRTVRTFIAVELSPDVRGRAMRLIERFRATGAKVHWVANQNLHVTLKFLGDVESVEIPTVCQAVQSAVAGIQAFDLEFHGAGAFPTAENPRTVWLGVRAGGESMIQLHRCVEDGLAKLGFRVEGRRFRPHVTIGRVRDTRHAKRDLEPLLIKYAEFEGGISYVDEIVVFASFLKPDGPEYEPLGSVELADPR